MQNSFHSISQRTGVSNFPVSVSTKTLQTENKALGTTQDPALVSWYEQAYAYYNAVVAGDPNTPRPNPQDWNNFLTQMQWAASQLGYGAPQGQNFNPLGAAAAQGPMQSGGMTGSLLQGAKQGTMGNLVYSDETADITFTGGDTTNDIWSNQVHINVPSLSAKVTSEVTNDTRLSPPEAVLKITVTDPATGSQSVYFVHDFSDADIQVNTPHQNQLTSSGGKVTWSEYQDQADAPAKPDASIQGTSDGKTGKTIYEPDYAGTTVDFFANPGKDQTSVVYADANINVKPSDQVDVKNGSDGTILVTVQHRDGSKDAYEIQKGFKVNINANEENLTINGVAASNGVPSELSDRLTVNGATGSKNGSSGEEILGNFLSAVGKNETQLMTALHSAGFFGVGGYDTIQDFKKALQDGSFPPSPLDTRFFTFLNIIDQDPKISPNFHAAWENWAQAEHSGKHPEQAKGPLVDRLTALLQILEPNALISAETDPERPGSPCFSVNGAKQTLWTDDVYTGSGLTWDDLGKAGEKVSDQINEAIGSL